MGDEHADPFHKDIDDPEAAVLAPHPPVDPDRRLGGANDAGLDVEDTAAGHPTPIDDESLSGVILEPAGVGLNDEILEQSEIFRPLICGRLTPMARDGAKRRWGSLTPLSRRSGNQPIAAGLCNQQLGIRRVAFDLLAQTVDVRFQRVGVEARVVTPDLAEHTSRLMTMFADRNKYLRVADSFSVSRIFLFDSLSIRSLAPGR